jgi:hypothetical protein
MNTWLIHYVVRTMEQDTERWTRTPERAAVLTLARRRRLERAADRS